MEKFINSNKLKLWTDAIGDSDNYPCLLIAGAGAPAMFWSDNFCRKLADANYFVIRYDHRDQGLSDGVNWDKNPYTVKDLAQDAINILDAYEIAKAHVVGHSMGGIVAQLLAVNYPERLISFTSMSVSTTKNGAQPSKEIMDALLENKPTQSFDDDLSGFMRSWEILNGDYGVDEDIAVAYTRDMYERSNYDVGVAWNHIRCQKGFEDLAEKLPKNKIPALFIHGEKDPLISLASAKQNANITANSKFIVIPGMGHMFFDRKLEQKIAQMLLNHFHGAETT